MDDRCPSPARLLAAGLLLAVAALLGLVPSAAGAQAWSFSEGGAAQQRAAAICGQAGSELVCLSLSCAEGQELGLAFQSSVPADGPVAATLSVDGGPPEPVTFAGARYPGGPSVATWDRAATPALIRRLQLGNSVRMVYGPAGDQRQIDLTLRGSARALSAALDACPEPLARVPDPMDFVLEQMLTTCEAAGAIFAPSDGLIANENLNDDGIPDAVINWSKAGCGTRESLCDAGGCQMTFLTGTPEGTFRKALEIRGDSYLIVPTGPQFYQLVIYGSGDYCASAQAAPCKVIYDWGSNGEVIWFDTL